MKVKEDRNARILVIPDLHHPYSHRDSSRFLEAVAKRFKPTRVVCLGDEVDKHALSFHDSDPDLPSAGDELDLAIASLQPLYKLFPEMDLLESNHGSLAFRRAKAHGLPKRYMKDYREVLEAPAGWVWHSQLILRSGPRDIFFTHGMSKCGLKLANRLGMSTVQGHFHTELNVRWAGAHVGVDRFSLQSGCLINDRSLAMAYNKLHLERPLLGCSTIENGTPGIVKMNLDSKDRWDGKL